MGSSWGWSNSTVQELLGYHKLTLICDYMGLKIVFSKMEMTSPIQDACTRRQKVEFKHVFSMVESGKARKVNELVYMHGLGPQSISSCHRKKGRYILVYTYIDKRTISENKNNVSDVFLIKVLQG